MTITAVRSDRRSPGAGRHHELRLLGAFALSSDGQLHALPRGGQRLLAYLALQPGRERELVAGTLWPDVVATRALGNLRSTLWRLSRAGLRLSACGPSLSLPPDVDVDVHRLFRAAVERRQSEVDAETHAWFWSAGADELLPGWYDDWVLVERERLRQLRLHVGEAMAERLCRSGQHAAALQVALQVVAFEPLRESAHRLVISVHLAEGNISEAVRQYRTCCALLSAELGVGPSPLLQRLVQGAPARGGLLPYPRFSTQT
ncbi:MAG: putative DNA-binding transcriptional activator of the family [Frankiales bacterium]|nr:putative DNA-binding transcriptional activator of the family [Frankiales bacterium]